MASHIVPRKLRLIGAGCLLAVAFSGAAVALASHHVDSDELNFVYVIGGPTPGPKSFAFFGTGACNGGTVATNPTSSWLQVSPTSLPAFPQSGGTHQQTFSVSVNVSSPTPGTYTGTVTVDPQDNNEQRSDEPCDEPKTVEVTLRILGPGDNERPENHGQCVSLKVHEALENGGVDGHEVSQWAREECDDFLPEQAQKDKNDDRPGIEARGRGHDDGETNPSSADDGDSRGRSHSHDGAHSSSGRGRGR